MNINIDEIIIEMTSIHNQLNKLLFRSSLKPIKIGIETAKFRRTCAWAYFESAPGWKDELSQITFLTSRWNGNYIKIIGTLVHEMCHQYNYENNIKDVEPSNGRHNKNFKATAINLGMLIVEKPVDKNAGLGVTSPSDELVHIIENKLDFNKAALKIIHSDAIGSFKPKQNNFKYECNCSSIVYSRKEVNVSCNDCGGHFTLKSV